MCEEMHLKQKITTRRQFIYPLCTCTGSVHCSINRIPGALRNVLEIETFRYCFFFWGGGGLTKNYLIGGGDVEIVEVSQNSLLRSVRSDKFVGLTIRR